MKILGFTEDFTVCECCGKKNLKGTFAFTTNQGETLYWGSSCIKKAFTMDQKEFSAKVKADEILRRNEARAEYLATPEGAFYKSYIGSDQHGIDINLYGFSFVAAKIKPAKIKAEEITKKYGFKYISF
jgi:hypothetical protein